MARDGWMEKFAGDWWAGCVAENGQVRLEELPAHWMSFECILGLMWMVGCTANKLLFDVVSGRYGDDMPTQLRCYFKCFSD